MSIKDGMKGPRVAMIILTGLLTNPVQLHAQNSPLLAPIVKGVSVYGMDSEQNFPIMVRDSVDGEGKCVRCNEHVTIQFDVLAADPPPLKIRFWHCDRNWHRDENVFVQDVNHTTSFHLDFRTSPTGVTQYNYRYINSFPDNDGAVRFDYSGNWVFELLDKEETTVLADGRFFVVDRIARTTALATNEYLTANASPFNQVNKLTVNVKLPNEIDGYYYTTVDVYQNRRFQFPYRIDANDRNPYTFVEGYNTGFRIFSISNISPGNEYRTLDLSNTTRYPNKSLVRLVEGADQQRFYWRTGADRNGAAILNKFSGANSDYLEVLFRLDLTESDARSIMTGERDIYLAGPFNNWEPEVEDKLVFDEHEQSWTVKKLLRRGIYDYQYVAGVWDNQTKAVVQQDWTVLEGNDWRTSNMYTAFVHYNDPRFGSFDRIVGYAHANSSTAPPGSQ
jgi:hypothetical protein